MNYTGKLKEANEHTQPWIDPTAERPLNPTVKEKKIRHWIATAINAIARLEVANCYGNFLVNVLHGHYQEE